MPDTQFPPETVPARADALRPFVCSRAEGALNAAWVQVAGALDIATAPQLVDTLRESLLEARLVVLDLRELAFMDCSGVHAIVDAGIRARRVGRRLVVLRGPANADRLFSLTGTSDQVEIGDLGPVESSFRPLQRSLVSASLLKSGERPDSSSHRAP